MFHAANKLGRKRLSQILVAKQLIAFQEVSIPLTRTPSKAFTDLKPASLWMTTRGDRLTTSRTNFRIRLTVNCHGLETDASRFRIRTHAPHNSGASCRLCNMEEETPEHFVETCPALQRTRSMLIEKAPQTVKTLMNQQTPLFDLVIGSVWVEDRPTQRYITKFVHTLRQQRLLILGLP